MPHRTTGAPKYFLEKATLKNGGIEQANFDTYRPLRMSQLPEVAVCGVPPR